MPYADARNLFNYQAFIREVEKERRRRGISKNQLCYELGRRPDGRLLQHLRGNNKPTLKLLIELARWADLSIDKYVNWDCYE